MSYVQNICRSSVEKCILFESSILVQSHDIPLGSNLNLVIYMCVLLLSHISGQQEHIANPQIWDLGFVCVFEIDLF